MFDPQIFEDHDAHDQMPDWFAHLLVLASYALAFLAGWLAG
jgi:hypothetical protein